MTERIDAHHHLWRYSAGEYEWIDESMRLLRRDFLANDLIAAMASAENRASLSFFLAAGARMRSAMSLAFETAVSWFMTTLDSYAPTRF